MIYPLVVIGSLLAIHWYFSLFGQTFFHHRYWSHAMFTMSKRWERFFHLFTYVVQGSSYLSPRTYAVMHRLHHHHSDTEQDPHSPKYFKTILSLMWNMKQRYAFLLRYDPALSEDEKNSLAERILSPKGRVWFNKLTRLDSEFLQDLPNKSKWDQAGDSYISRVAWGVLYAIPYYFIATYLFNNGLGAYWWVLLVYPLHFFMGPIQGTIVNWFGHWRWGYQNFNNKDDSKNFVLWADIFLLGELFQNNHHHNAKKANFAAKKSEWDPLYPVLLLLDKFRIIKLHAA